MAFKLKSGNRPSFKQMITIGKEPMAESPYMQSFDEGKKKKFDMGDQVGELEGYTYDPVEKVYVKNPDEKSQVTTNETTQTNQTTQTKQNEKPVAPSQEVVKEAIEKDTNVTRTQYVDGKLRKKTTTYVNPKSLQGTDDSGVQEISQKEKPGRGIIKTKIKFTDASGNQYIQKEKKKPGKPPKVKTRKKGSLLSIQDKEKAKKFLNRFKKK